MRQTAWYYYLADEVVGPYTLDDIRTLRVQGYLQPDTLVWHEGMSEWQTYQHAVPPDPPEGPIHSIPRARAPAVANFESQRPAAQSRQYSGAISSNTSSINQDSYREEINTTPLKGEDNQKA